MQGYVRAVLFSHVADITPLEKFLFFTLNIQLTDDILLPLFLFTLSWMGMIWERVRMALFLEPSDRVKTAEKFG